MASERICPACQFTRLSRYNQDPVCAECARSARDNGCLVPLWLWDSPPLRRALAELDLGAFVATLRSATGLTQLELADLLGSGWSQNKVSLIEAARRDTLFDIRQLLRFADTFDMPREVLASVILGYPEDEAAAELGEATGMDMNRRHFAGAVVGVAAGMGLDRVPIEVPPRVEAAHVRYLKASIDRLWAQDQQVGGGMLYRAALRQLARVRTMLDDSDYTEPIGRRLFSAAAELTACTAWLSYDAGLFPQAHVLYNEALTYGRLADNDELAVLALEKMTTQAFLQARDNRGYARHGLRLIEAAKTHARGWATPRVWALLELRTARAHALLADELGYRQALARARRHFDAGPREDDPVWINFVDEAEVSAQTGLGLLDLGLPAKAVTAFEHDLGHRKSPRNRIFGRMNLAGAVLGTGDVAGACGLALDTLPTLTHTIRSGRALAELRRMRDQVAHDHSPAAREFRDAVETLAS